MHEVRNGFYRIINKMTMKNITSHTYINIASNDDSVQL